jgi:hypothetical protein
VLLMVVCLQNSILFKSDNTCSPIHAHLVIITQHGPTIYPWRCGIDVVLLRHFVTKVHAKLGYFALGYFELNARAYSLRILSVNY